MPDFRREAERRTGQPLDDRALSDYWAAQTWQAVRAQPGLAIARMLHKLRLALHDDESPDSEGVELVALWSPVLRAPALWFGQLLVLAAIGAGAGARQRGVRIVLVVVAVYLASLLPFFVMARLRVQLVPLLAVLAGGGLAWLAAQLIARRARPLLAASVVALFAGLVAFQRPEWMAQRRQSALAIGWNNLGASLQASGRSNEAVRAYERAVAIDARAVPASLRALGQLHQARGEPRKAARALQRVVELKPDSPSARRASYTFFQGLLRDPARVRLGIELLQDAVRAGPYDEGLHYALGEAMARHASGDELIAFFSSELAHDEKPQTSHYYWAVGLDKNGDLAAAIAQLKRALEVDPAHELSQLRWGQLLERQGQPEQALAHYDEAARIHPDFRDALQAAARVAQQLGRSAASEAYLQKAAQADPRSPRRYLHWARYLHAKGRDEAALAEVERMLAERPGDAEALALKAALQGRAGADATARPVSGSTSGSANTNTNTNGSEPGGGGWQISAEARTAFARELSAAPAGSRAWLQHDARDPSALRAARELADAFAQAGWQVAPIAAIDFAIRPGLYFFAADDPPSASAASVQRALAAAQLGATIGTGYRAYAEERRRADPSWAGFRIPDDQPFVLAIGRHAP